jgi:hypothetical protein
MAYIESSFPPIDVWVRREYLYDMEEHHGEFDRGRMVSVKCLTGQVPLFQVLLENGVMRDKLPCSAFVVFDREIDPTEAPAMAFDHLCLWNSFSKNFSIVQLNYLGSVTASAFLKDKKWYDGEYFATIQWAGDTNENADLTLSETPHEHKSHHIILLHNGNIALQPNNRVRWIEPSFTTKEFPARPDYKVCTQTFNAEGYEKWVTEDSDRYMYGTEEVKDEMGD